MGNRKYPFGYHLAQGVLTIHPEESEVVKTIFTSYSSGESYQTILETLREQSVPYDEGRLWNKSMVARILEDRRYLGTDRFPALILQPEFQIVQEKRNRKNVLTERSQGNKLLRQLSGKSCIDGMEQQVLYLLNRLVQEPDRIQPPSRPARAADKRTLSHLQNHLTSILSQLPADEEEARRVMYQIASARYSGLNTGIYESQRLRHIFNQQQPKAELDLSLLKSTVSEIVVHSSGRIALRLKNNQIIGKEM